MDQIRSSRSLVRSLAVGVAALLAAAHAWAAGTTQTATYTAGTPGTEYHTTFSWTVTNVLSKGTFADGSPWVRVAAGSQLIAVSPQSEYRTTASGFTVAVNGSAKNPRMQMYVDPQTLSIVTVGKQLFDSRRIFLAPPSGQAALDATFDFASNIGMPDPATGLIAPVPLVPGDVVVTARSRWVEGGSFTWTEGGSLPNCDLGRRTAIDRFGVLTVLATAPAVPSFRPPLQWRPGFESTRPGPIPVSSVIGNETALLHSGGVDHAGVELLLTSPTFHEGNGILYQSSQAQHALSEDPGRQGTIVYGANQAKLVMEPVLFAATDASLASSVRVPVRNRLIQYGIDCYGVAMSLGNTKAGAGQRAAELKPWILLAGWWLGRAEMRDVFGSIRGMYAGTAVSGLSDGDLGRLLFHEDFVAVQVKAGLGLGAPYHQVWGPGQTYRVTGSSTAGSAGIMDAGTLFGQFGRMEIDGAAPHPGIHARHPHKYYGCSLVIEGGAGAGDTVYRVVEVGEASGSIGSYVIVDRPWQAGGPDATSTVRMFPFRNGDFVPGLTADLGRWYFSTKGQLSMPGVDCLSPVADSYARVSFRAVVAPYAALKRLADFTGNRDYVRGNAWHLLAEAIGGTGLSPVDGVRYGAAPDSERIYSQIWSSWRHASLRPAELAVVKDWIGDDGTWSGFGRIDRSRFPGAISSTEGDPGEPCSQIVDVIDGVHGIESRPGHDLLLPSGCSIHEVAWFRYTAPQSGIVVVDTELGFDFDTAIAVVSDCAGTQVFGCDRGSATEGARVSFAAEAGASYLIALGGGLSGSYGTALLRVAGPGYTGGEDDGDLGWDPDETIDFIPCELAPVIDEGLIEFQIEPGLDLEVYHSCLSTEAGFERIYNPVLMRFTPAENGRFVASLCGGTVVDTRMVVIEGCDTGTVIACSDDATDCWWTSEVTFDVTAGRDYILVIGTSDPEQYDTAYLNFHRIPDPPEPKRRLMTVGVTKVTWNGGMLSGITPMDVVLCDQVAGNWSMWFDGSDVGLAAGMIDALALLPDGSLVMSFSTSITLPGLVGGPDGTAIADRCDLVRFVPTSLGWNTAGTWHFHLDGSDVGLLGTAEDVDAVEILPDGSYLLSTKGKVTVPGFANIPAASILKLQPTSLGATTAGTWSMHFDANDVGLLLASENVDAVAVGPGGEHCLSTVGAFEVTGAIGSGADGLEFFPQLLGPYTAGDFRVAFRGLEIGLGYSVKLNAMAELPES